MLTFARGVVLAVAAVAVVPASAAAVYVPVTGATVTGDSGSPVPITAGLTIKQMNAEVALVGSGTLNSNITTVVRGPDGLTAASRQCGGGTGLYVDYHGNGGYAVQVTQYADDDHTCAAAPTAASQFTYTVAAGVALQGPTSKVLLRQPGSFSYSPVALPISLSPGALGSEIRYAKNATVGADGGIAGTSIEGYADSATGTVPLSIREPGTYTVVARQKGFVGFFTPWSAPVTFSTVVPFDITSMSFLDSLGPSYQIGGYVGEDALIGSRLVVKMARGNTGVYKTVGRPVVRTGRKFSFRFTQRKRGTYRLRISFAGSSLVAGGYNTRSIRIYRIAS